MSTLRGPRVQWDWRAPARLIALIALAFLATPSFAQSPATVFHLGRSVAPLDGPWRFQAGDDYRYAQPGWDDSRWETVKLTTPPPPAAAEWGQVRPIPGWSARGHPGHAGYGWYRVRVVLDGAAGAPVAIAAPTQVDGGYQLYVDGALVDQIGDFSGSYPVLHSIRPRLIRLPQASPDQKSFNLAFRVWTPGPVTDPAAGGLRSAPQIGVLENVRAVVEGQWVQTFKGYFVDAAEAAGILVLALMVVGLVAVNRTNQSYLWLCAALVMTALVRVDQAAYFWSGVLSFRIYDLIGAVLLTPAALFAWVMAWRFWFEHRRLKWLTAAMAGLTGLYMAVALGARPWFSPGNPAQGTFAYAVDGIRIAFVSLYFLVVVAATWKNRASWAGMLAFLAAICAAVGLFAPELSTIGLKGVWFPFGAPVSRTQFAFAALIVVVFVAVLERFVRLASPPKTEPLQPDAWGPIPPGAALAAVPVMVGPTRRPRERTAGVP